MDESILLQKQIRENAQEMQDYLADMKQWLDEMKRKQDPTISGNQSPVVQENVKKAKQSAHAKGRKEQTDKPKRISSYDYAKWDNFDVEKACEEIDKDDIPEVNFAGDPEEEETQSLRDQALYEKELGNEQVKKQNWKEAIHYYNRAISCYAYDPVFYANRALCFLKTKDSKSAETDCTTAIQLDTTYVKAYIRRAQARSELRQYKDAKEDLEKVLELEPNNTVAKSELTKVEKKLLSPPQKHAVPKKVKKVSTPPSTTSAPKTDKTVLNEPISAGNKVVEKGQGDAEESVISSKVSWQTSNVTLVQTIYKPPHLRSKKPLKRIVIQDVNDIDLINKSCGDSPDDIPLSSRDSEVNLLDDTAKQEEHEVKLSEVAKPSEKLTMNSQACLQNTVDTSQQVPPAPKSSVQFILSWKAVKFNEKLRFLFLKQISGRELAHIFDNSLESDIVSDLVSVFCKDFMENAEPIYPYLLGLSQVQRFKALVMFLSKTDKAGIKKLLDHCVNSGECSEDEAKKLAKEYEVC